MAWNKDVPAAGIQARYLDDAVRENNAAVDAVFGDLLDAGAAVTATAAELNILDGVTSSAAELNILDGVTSSAAELNQCDGKTLVNTTDTQSIGGAKTFTAGLTVTGGALKLAPASGAIARITGSSTASTMTSMHAGGYETTGGSAAVQAFSIDDATLPGKVLLIGSNGTVGTVGVEVDQDGTVNLPVALQIGGVAVAAPIYTSFSPGGDLYSGTVHITKSGRNVTMTWTNMGHTAGYSAAAGFTLAAAYRPVASIIVSTYLAAAHTTRISVNSTGTFSFMHLDWTGTTYSTTSVIAGSVSWVSAS